MMQLNLDLVKRIRKFVKEATLAMDESGLADKLVVEGSFLDGLLMNEILKEERKPN